MTRGDAPSVSADQLARAAAAVVDEYLAIRSGENVLVVSDPGTTRIGEALVDAARASEADPVLVVVPPNPARGTEPPPPVAAALSACDVFIAPCEPSLSHTTARERATARGARGATMPGVTAGILARCMSGERDAMAHRCHAIATLLTEVDSVRVVCPRGTDLRLDVRGRSGIPDDGNLRGAGAWGNLPCGEAYISPADGDGRALVHSIATIGIQPEPVELVIEGGRLTEARGGDGPRLMETLSAHGELGRNLAELGIGTNEQATLTGNVLEDEKVLGTVHVAFGASASIGGGVAVPVHIDSVIVDPTVMVGSTKVIDEGRFAL